MLGLFLPVYQSFSPVYQSFTFFQSIPFIAQNSEGGFQLLYLILLVGAMILAGSQRFLAFARWRKSVGRVLLVFGLLEILFFGVSIGPSDSLLWEAGVWVSQLGMLLTIAGGILIQTDQWSILTLQQRVGYVVVWISRIVAFVAFDLPYFYIVVGTRYSQSQTYSGWAILIILGITLFILEPAVAVVALFVSRKLLIAIGAIGIVLHLWLMMGILYYMIGSHFWVVGAYLYPLSMIGLIVGGVLTMKGTKRPVATTNTMV